MPALAEDVRRTGTLSNPGDTLTFNQPGTAVVAINLVVTPNATFVFEANIDEGASPTWVGVPGVSIITGAQITSVSASDLVKIDMSGFRALRVRCVSSDGGNAVVTMNGTVAPSSTDLVISKGGVAALPVITTDPGGNPAAPATDFELRNVRSLLEEILIELRMTRQNQGEQLGAGTYGLNTQAVNL